MRVINAKDTNAVKESAEVIRSGGLVAFPTDTVYGLGADASNAGAVRRIYGVKGRKGDKPLVFLVADEKEVFRYVDDVPGGARILMEKFWPGPLTIILKGSGGGSVAFRMPDCQFALELIIEAGVPLVATSANRSGESAHFDAGSVRADLGDKIDLIVDGGHTKHGEGSSIVDLTGEEVKIIREGPVRGEDIKSIITQFKNQNAN